MTFASREIRGATADSFGCPRPPKWSSVSAALSRALGTIPPTGLLLLAILSVQMGSVLAVNLFATLGPGGTVFLRVAFGAVLVAIAAPPVFDRTLRDHAWMVVLFGVVIAIQNLCFFQALARIPLGVAVTIEFMGPLAVAVLTSRRLADFMWIALAATGLALLTPAIGSGLDPLGVMFAGITGCAWAAFILLSVRMGRIFPGGTGLSPAMIVAAIVLLPFATFGTGMAAIGPLVLLAALAVAVLSTSLPTILEYEALKTLPPRNYGIILAIEPVIAMIAGAILLGDGLTVRGMIAAAAVMTAAIGATYTARRTK